MRLGWTTGAYSTTYRAIKTVRVDGKNKSLIVKNFGSEKYIRETYGVEDAKAWAKEEVQRMNQEEQEETPSFDITLNSNTDLALNEQNLYNGGYLFLQFIYYQLGLDKICTSIKTKYKFEYNLNAIFSRLLYTRILYPASKLSSFQDSNRFIESPDFELHQIYRALSVLAKESDYIQSRLFKNSMSVINRQTQIIYYDCTNFYFETEEAEDDKQYGVSKENRPNPIVQMGLFMDREGIPLAFSINKGNENEQKTLIPLEKTLLQNFDLSRFVVCTDAGLSSNTNRYFNHYDKENGSRDFITTQSIKKLKGKYKEFALEHEGWHLFGDKTSKLYTIDQLDEEQDKDKIFYKRCTMKEKVSITKNDVSQKETLEQQLIVTYSIKYRDYLRSVRMRQVERAKKSVEDGEKSINRKRQNDPKRFIQVTHATEEGEVANKALYSVNEKSIANEEMYDGFYAVCTSLTDNPEAIVRVNKCRWEIEECFRIMKSEFLARPVYLKRQERIIAHFITCFISLILYRILEKKLNNQYTCPEIISTLQEMNFLKYVGKGYQPTYKRTALTDALHDAFGICTSKQIIPIKKMRNFCAISKI